MIDGKTESLRRPLIFVVYKSIEFRYNIYTQTSTTGTTVLKLCANYSHHSLHTRSGPLGGH